MTYKQTRSLFVDILNTNAYLNICEIDDMKNIVDALDKQIHKFVLCPKGFQGMRDTRYYCPNCKKAMRRYEAYCHNCGQAVKYPKEVYDKPNNKWVLDWSETDEH